MFSGIFLVCTTDTEGPEICTAEEANGVGDMRSGNINGWCTDILEGLLRGLSHLGLFSPTAEVSGLPQ